MLTDQQPVDGVITIEVVKNYDHPARRALVSYVERDGEWHYDGWEYA